MISGKNRKRDPSDSLVKKQNFLWRVFIACFVVAVVTMLSGPVIEGAARGLLKKSWQTTRFGIGCGMLIMSISTFTFAVVYVMECILNVKQTRRGTLSGRILFSCILGNALAVVLALSVCATTMWIGLSHLFTQGT